MTSNLNVVFKAARPKFLILAPICVFVAIAGVHYKGLEIDMALAVSCVLVALLAHMSVNLLNEHHDALSGLDDITQRTPFSGGSGALQSAPNALMWVRNAGWATVLLTCLVGLYIVLKVQLWLSILGFVGLAIVVLYTPFLNKSPWLCLVSPGLAFGFLMINGTYIALTGSFDTFALLISVSVFCLVNNLLLLNQFPDAHADKSVGRNHFVIAKGYKKASLAYLGFAVLCYLWVMLLIVKDVLPIWALAVCLGLPLSILISFRASQFELARLHGLLPFMAMNVAITLLLPSTLALVMFVS
jgi:1,4-dihydroxy-2-naphthoate octaprenyltransferase